MEATPSPATKSSLQPRDERCRVLSSSMERALRPKPLNIPPKKKSMPISVPVEHAFDDALQSNHRPYQSTESKPIFRDVIWSPPVAPGSRRVGTPPPLSAPSSEFFDEYVAALSELHRTNTRFQAIVGAEVEQNKLDFALPAPLPPASKATGNTPSGQGKPAPLSEGQTRDATPLHIPANTTPERQQLPPAPPPSPRSHPVQQPSYALFPTIKPISISDTVPARPPAQQPRQFSLPNLPPKQHHSSDCTQPLRAQEVDPRAWEPTPRPARRRAATYANPPPGLRSRAASYGHATTAGAPSPSAASAYTQWSDSTAIASPSASLSSPSTLLRKGSGSASLVRRGTGKSGDVIEGYPACFFEDDDGDDDSPVTPLRERRRRRRGWSDVGKAKWWCCGSGRG